MSSHATGVPHVASTTEFGRRRRISRLFAADGRTLVIGYDHAVSVGTAGGALTDLPALARASVRGVADGLQMSLHSTRMLDPSLLDERAFGLVLRVDRSAVGDDPHQVLGEPTRWASARQVIQADGDAAVVFYVHDTRRATERSEYALMTSEVASECADLGLPLMVEVMVKTDEEASDVELSTHMVDATRIAFELGADLVKIDRTPSPGALADLAAAVPIPVLLRGGPPLETARETAADLGRCLDAGFAGAVYGRSVWRHDDPERMTRELHAAVHGK